MLAHAAPLIGLSAADVPALLKPPSHGERIIELWALDCAYCESNMQAAAAFQRAHPDDVQLITVATDSIAQKDAILERLHATGLDRYAARAYTDATPERINYLFDPRWGGETPRTLVIHANGATRGISGALTPQRLSAL
jgi:iron complex outermembrane receptor protein